MGLFQINNKRLYDSNLYVTNNEEISLSFGVRPVVVLGGNTKITKNDENDGSTKDKACAIN